MSSPAHRIARAGLDMNIAYLERRAVYDGTIALELAGPEAAVETLAQYAPDYERLLAQRAMDDEAGVP